MMENTQTQELSYKSTRETAKILQVSLGTIQKMVETGELLAWKTRGGHRRILTSSLEQLIKRRRLGLKEKCKERIVMLALMHSVEEFESMKRFINAWEAQVNLHPCADSLEALMFSVSLAPDVIYIDHAMTPIEQVHVLHYLTRNAHTRNIPILVEEKFLKMHAKKSPRPSEYYLKKLYSRAEGLRVIILQSGELLMRILEQVYHMSSLR